MKSMCARIYEKIIIFPGVKEGSYHPWGAFKGQVRICSKQKIVIMDCHFKKW